VSPQIELSSFLALSARASSIIPSPDKRMVARSGDRPQL
jgi:hypothetical protein